MKYNGHFSFILGLWLFFFGAEAPHAQASIAVHAPSLAEEVFQGQIAAHSGLMSLAASLESATPKQQETERLSDFLEKAQRAFLSGSLEDAQRKFSALAQLAHEADWPPAQRRALFYAYLRVAQLSDNTTSRREQLRTAASFAPELNIDTEIFPPPLVSEFKKIHSDMQMKALLVPVRDLFSDFTTIRIDGRSYSIATAASGVRVFPGNHRVTLLSNVYAPLTLIINASQLVVTKPALQAIAAGSCARPEPHAVEGLDKKALIVIYNENCAVQFTNGEWRRIWQDSETPDLGTSPIPAEKSAWQSPLTTPLTTPVTTSLTDEPVKPGRPFFKRPWFWVGIGAVVTSSLILLQRSRTSARQPLEGTPAPPPAGPPVETQIEVQPSSREGF